SAYRLLWRPRTRERYDHLYNASARRMQWTLGLGAVSVLLLVTLGLGSGFWLTSQSGHQVSLQAPVPFIKPAASPTTARATRATPLNPSSMTLAVADLPSGYHVLSQGPASFSTGSASSAQKSAAPPSWDV